MKSWADQHQVIAGAGATPSLADVATLTAPDGVSLTATLAMTRGAHARLKVVLDTLFGTNHTTVMSMKEVNVDIMERETYLEDYNPRYQGLKYRLLASIPIWTQIRLSDWFARQW